MSTYSSGRRSFLKTMSALGAAGAAGLKPAAAEAAYDPAAKFELKVSEVPFHRTPKGRQLMARVYQPQGTGPFPTVLDLHGGAWNRRSEEHTSELQSLRHLVCRLLLEKKKKQKRK